MDDTLTVELCCSPDSSLLPDFDFAVELDRILGGPPTLKSIPIPGNVRPFLVGASGGSCDVKAVMPRPPPSLPNKPDSAASKLGPVGVSKACGSGRTRSTGATALFFPAVLSNKARLPLRTSPLIRFLDILKGSLVEGMCETLLTLVCDCVRALEGGDSSSILKEVSS